MPFLARELITQSYYLSGIVSRQFQTVSGDQITDGLFLLNVLLFNKVTDQNAIPYFKEYTLNAVIGQEKYFIPDLIDIQSFTFNVGTVRYSTLIRGRRAYFGSARVDDIRTLPFSWHMERTQGGSNLYLYFLPADTYPLKIWGKFGFDDVTLDTDMSTTYELYYLNFLRYELAEEICADNNIMLQPQVSKKLMMLRQKIITLSPKDLSIQKFSTLQKGTSINYADVNVGKGWRPS
jgi:hypothetical protein